MCVTHGWTFSDHRYAGLERNIQSRSVNLSNLSQLSAATPMGSEAATGGGSAAAGSSAPRPGSLSYYQLNLTASSGAAAGNSSNYQMIDDGDEVVDGWCK